MVDAPAHNRLDAALDRLEEVEKIAFRDRQLQTRRSFGVEDEIEELAKRLMREAP